MLLGTLLLPCPSNPAFQIRVLTCKLCSSTHSNRSPLLVTEHFPHCNYRVRSEPAFKSTFVPDLKLWIPKQATLRKTFRRWVTIWEYCWSAPSIGSAADVAGESYASSPAWLCGCKVRELKKLGRSLTADFIIHTKTRLIGLQRGCQLHQLHFQCADHLFS